MHRCFQVVTTLPRNEDAQRMAQTLVEKRLAACVQITGPIESTYRWKDEVETAQEWLCFIKTSEQRWDELERAIRDLHPYQTPEVIALPVTAGSSGYLEWLHEQVRQSNT